MFQVVDADLLRVWVRTAVAALGEARAEIDALNVFPVPDGDTGTNMYLTMEAAERGMAESEPSLDDDADPADRLTQVAEVMVREALLGARGNSGVILSQILRGMVRVAPLVAGELRPAGEAIRLGLRRGADMAYAAVADPKEGTMLTVIRKAADGAAASEADDLGSVVRAATEYAQEALGRTTEQLEALRRAGVVDSGGRGIVVILSALQEVVTGERRPPPAPTQRVPIPTGPQDGAYGGPGYEVMYLLEAADEAIPDLKQQLGALGDSLLVVGGEGLWNIHVHVDDAGAAVEAGMRAGRPYRVRITWLLEGAADHAHRTGRGIVAVAYGPGMAELLTDMGITPVSAQPGLAPATGEVLDAVLSQAAGEVVILPGDKNIHSSAEAAAVTAREQGQRVAVVPTRSIVQSLAAIAVHDPGLAFDDDVVGMSRAAGATRYGAVTVSTREAMTTAGRCAPGDVLGVVDGDILRIGADLQQVAKDTLDLLLSSGGELATIVTGADAKADLVAGVSDHLAAHHPGVDMSVYEGGQPLWPLIFGIE